MRDTTRSLSLFFVLLSACAGDKAGSADDTGPGASDDADGDGVPASEDHDDGDPDCWRPPADIEGEIEVVGEDELASVCDGMCPGTVLHGSLVVSAPDLTDLSALSCLTEVDRSLRITGLTGLSSLRGLQNVKRVGETFHLQDLPALTNLDPLANLGEVGLGITLWGLPGVTTLAPLSGVHALGLGNPFAEVGGFQVNDCDGLSTLAGLDTLVGAEQPADGYQVLLTMNDGLTSLAGLDWMTGGTLEISDNPPLTSVAGTGLSSLNLLSISSQPNLEDLSGLTGVDIAALELVQLDSLTTLEGPSWASTLGGLTVDHVTGLVDLARLDTVTAVNFDLILRGNSTLRSLHGLEQLDSVGGNLEITDNPVLSSDFVDELVDQVTVGGTTTVSGNGT